MAAGAPFNVRPTGPSDIRRIEGGIFNWGADMTYENNPLRDGPRPARRRPARGRLHLGRRAAADRAAGVERRINGVELDGEPFPALNNVKWSALRRRTPMVGKVTSAIYSPRLEKNIGYCWLPAALSDERHGPSTSQTEWGDRTATVVEMPFVDPDKRIPVG